MGTSMLALDQSFFYYPSIFSSLDWVMLIGMTMSVIGAQTFKLWAFQNQTASKLQVLGNLQMVYQFGFDVFLFNIMFSDL
jgi:drug/metabolite transporter (DMT)-like permease